ncbi:MAG: trigger factor [Planctomycetes bacterium SCN 63-9]|nr:MAG: trigger factor [Planctomycetes bacterium SCN 63-9]
MSSGDHESDASVGTIDEAAAAEIAAKDGAEPKRKLEIDVQIQDVGPCKKHLKVTIPREEIEKQFEDSLGSFQRDAQVPGFRPGKAPRQLVVKRFRKQVADQVKSSLLMSSLEQIGEEHNLNPITQPQLDIEAIELPDSGPMSFDMEVEVRPEFEVPDYTGIKAERPVKEITPADVDDQLTRFLERYARIVPKLEGGAEIGDHITADLSFVRDDQVLNEVKEIQFRLQPELRFKEGRIPGVGEALKGANPGDVREAAAEIGQSAVDPSIRGETIKVRFKVNDLKLAELPEATPAFLNSLGFENIEELREGLKSALERRNQNQQRQAIRRQVLDALLAKTPFDLPKDLVSRQEKDTIRRLVMELRQEGLSDNEIRAREAQIRANAHQATLRSLQEFFLLAKIAEAEKIAVEDSDLEDEIESIAERTGESVRRVRSRVEKEGLSDSLTVQILERKVLDRVLEKVQIEDVVVTGPDADANVETLDDSASASAEVSADESEDSQGSESAATESE